MVVGVSESLRACAFTSPTGGNPQMSGKFYNAPQGEERQRVACDRPPGARWRAGKGVRQADRHQGMGREAQESGGESPGAFCVYTTGPKGSGPLPAHEIAGVGGPRRIRIRCLDEMELDHMLIRIVLLRSNAIRIA